MAEHRASITIAAPVHQVYTLFSRFVDYPKFMTYVKEVTFVDEHTTKWSVDLAGRHTWTAVNENWIPDQQIGWRSTSGFRNSGRVNFTAIAADRTDVTMTIAYEPPAGPIGTAGELLGIGSTFEAALRHDLSAFASRVENAPTGALDPNSADYVFNPDRTTTDETLDRENPVDDDTSPVVPGTSRASRNAL